MNNKANNTPYTEIYAWGSDSNGQMGVSNNNGKKYTSPRFCSFNVIINHLSCGISHTAFIASNGCIYTMGSNEHGRLGIGSSEITNSFSPCLVESLSKFKAVQVSCGAKHTAALLDNGKAYFWGYGCDGQLGNDDLNCFDSPQILNLSHVKNSLKSLFVKYISCGNNHSMIITDEGNVCGFGSSVQGQLGTGQRKMEKLPIVISCFTEKIKKVACGVQHTLFLTQNKKVFACGENSQGQLGIGNKKNSLLPVKIMLLENFAIQKICASDFSAALSESGELYVWGEPYQNQLFPNLVSVSDNNIEEIDIGTNFCVCMDSEGHVYSWGNNTNGELGAGDFENKDTFINVTALKGRKIKGIYCGGNYAMVLGNTTTQDEVKLSNPSINEDIERLKEGNLYRNKLNSSNNNDNIISKRNRQYLKSYENVGTITSNNNSSIPGNKIETVINDAKAQRIGKSLTPTPIRHLTSEEIKSRQKVSFHNPKKNLGNTNNETEFKESTESQRVLESELPHENYIINNVDAEKIKNLIKNNEIRSNKEINKTSLEMTSTRCKIETKCQNSKEDEIISCQSPHQKILLNDFSLSLKNEYRKYDKYSKYTSFHEISNFSSDSKGKFEPEFKQNRQHFTSTTSRYNYEKESILSPQNEIKPVGDENEKAMKKHKVEKVEQPISEVKIEEKLEKDTQKELDDKKNEINEISLQEYNQIKTQMNNLLRKIVVFEEDQKEIENLKLEQNELKVNYTKLEQNYLNLEQRFKNECIKTEHLELELSNEKKKHQEQKNTDDEKIGLLNEKINEKDQDIKYLKTENLKSQNYFDENLKGYKEQEEKQLLKYEENLQQLSDSLKNLEDENKFLENNLQNKDSLLEKLKNENEELHKKVRKYETEEHSIYNQTIEQMKADIAEKERNNSFEKSNLLDDKKKLQKIIDEQEERIQNIYRENKKNIEDLNERDYRNKQEKNELANKNHESEKLLSEKNHEIDYLSKELKQEQYRSRQLEEEFEKMKRLLQEKKTSFDFYNSKANESHVINNPSPNFNSNSKSNKENIGKKLFSDSVDHLEKPSLKVKNLNIRQKIEDAPLLNNFNNEYYDKKQQSREPQKQLIVKNSNKTISEKSYSLSREFKIRKQGDEEIMTEAQNDKYEEENSMNNSGIFNSNIIEIKTKLSSLQKNKVFLEKRMKDFENKLKESKTQTKNN